MHPAESWRLFVAIPVPEAVRQAIALLQAAWKPALPRDAVRWTNGDQLHLTLKFLGEVETGRVQALTDALRTVGREAAPLRLMARGAGVFPTLRAPRVLWVGLSDLEGGLSPLQRAVETAATGFGRSEPAAPFTGHITLGRVREGARSVASSVTRLVSEAADRSFGEWTAGSIDLMRSELVAGAARHTRVAEVCLRLNSTKD